MKAIKFIFPILTLLFVACGEPVEEESPALKEARETQQHMLEIANSLKDKLAAQTADWRAEADTLLSKGDTLMAGKLNTLNTRLERLEERLKEWEEGVVEVPGTPHDHANCDHDHGPNPMEGMSGEEILVIQQELKSQIMALNDSLETVKNELTHANSAQTQP